MSRVQYAETLRNLPRAKVSTYLAAHSNLPGPRANLTLLDAAADVLPKELALPLMVDGDEFLASCGVATVGRLVIEEPGNRDLVALLTARAVDPRWRVRESVAIAVQRIGDHNCGLARSIAANWAADPDPLIARAGIAAICEPRLLRDPDTATAAIAACEAATHTLLAVPADHRRDPDVRVLRQALGYCWSVAVAGQPDPGLQRFLALPADDPDVDWIIRENRRKHRLTRLLH